jgi:hypothetical protein
VVFAPPTTTPLPLSPFPLPPLVCVWRVRAAARPKFLHPARARTRLWDRSGFECGWGHTRRGFGRDQTGLVSNWTGKPVGFRTGPMRMRRQSGGAVRFRMGPTESKSLRQSVRFRMGPGQVWFRTGPETARSRVAKADRRRSGSEPDRPDRQEPVWFRMGPSRVSAVGGPVRFGTRPG